MLDAIAPFFAHPLARGIMTGVIAAAAVDFGAFRSWKSWNEAASYDWRTASFRWFQGAIIGLLTSLGFNGLS